MRVAGEEQRRQHPVLALAYGAGLALIVDEFALLLDLQDVCWAKEGRVSVDLRSGTVSLGGAVFAAPVAPAATTARGRLGGYDSRSSG